MYNNRMTKIAVWMTLALALEGCAPGYLDPALLPQAIEIVWSHYKASYAEPPTVEISDQRCVMYEEGECVDGAFFEKTNSVVVGSANSWADSALAHELFHALQFRRTGGCYPRHLSRGWDWSIPGAEDALQGL